MPKKSFGFSYLFIYYSDWLWVVLFLRTAQFIGFTVISIFNLIIRLMRISPSIQAEIVTELFLLRKEVILWRTAAGINKTIVTEKRHGGLSLKSKLRIVAFVNIWKIPKRKIHLYLNISRNSYQRYITQLHYGLTVLSPKSKRPAYCPNITCQSIVKLVWRIKQANPHYGRIKIAMSIWQNGAYIHPTTVDKILKRPKPRFGPTKSCKQPVNEKKRSIPAYYPNHIWGIDLTTVYPFGLIGKLLKFPPYYILGVEDYYSRKILWLSRHNNIPSAQWVNKELRQVFKKYQKPKHMIADQGAQFTAPDFVSFIKGNGINLRYGKVGSALSNGRIERSFKSLKYECLNYFFIINDAKLDWLLKEYLTFYNNYRPNMAIAGQIPEERYRNIIKTPPDKNAKQLKSSTRKVSFANGVLNAFVSNSAA
jgi:transposase InsO family protein